MKRKPAAAATITAAAILRLFVSADTALAQSPNGVHAMLPGNGAPFVDSSAYDGSTTMNGGTGVADTNDSWGNIKAFYH